MRLIRDRGVAVSQLRFAPVDMTKCLPEPGERRSFDFAQNDKVYLGWVELGMLCHTQGLEVGEGGQRERLEDGTICRDTARQVPGLRRSPFSRAFESTWWL